MKPHWSGYKLCNPLISNLLVMVGVTLLLCQHIQVNGFNIGDKKVYCASPRLFIIGFKIPFAFLTGIYTVGIVVFHATIINGTRSIIAAVHTEKISAFPFSKTAVTKHESMVIGWS